MSEEEQIPLAFQGSDEARWLENARRNRDAFLSVMRRVAEQEGSMENGQERSTDGQQVLDL
jgi:hypothetical protein